MKKNFVRTIFCDPVTSWVMSPKCDISDDVASFHCTILHSSHLQQCFKFVFFRWFFFVSFSVVKWDAVRRVLPNLLLHRDYHQGGKEANLSEHPIIWLICMDNPTPMTLRTSLQNALLKI